MFKKNIILSLFLVASFMATTKNTYAMEAERPSDQKTSDSQASHDFNCGVIGSFMPDEDTSSSSSTQPPRKRKPRKPIYSYAPKTRIAGKIIEKKEETPSSESPLISKKDAGSSSESTSSRSAGRSRSFTFSDLPVPKISGLGKLEKIEEQKPEEPKTDQKRKEFKKSLSKQDLSGIFSSMEKEKTEETEKWYFSKPKPGYTVCALKGEIEKNSKNINDLYHNKETEPLIRRLRTLVGLVFKKPNFFKEQPLPQDLKQLCIQKGFCDQNGYLTDAAKYMILNLIEDGKLNKFEQLKHKNIIQLDRDRNKSLIEEYKEEKEENTLKDPCWEFNTSVYKYLRTTKKIIEKTYKTMLKLSPEERIWLGNIINNRMPQTEQHQKICDSLVTKKLIKFETTYKIMLELSPKEQIWLRNIINNRMPQTEQDQKICDALVTKKFIKFETTYKIMLELSPEELIWLGNIINKQMPQTEQDQKICDALVTKKFIEQNQRLKALLLVKYLHDIGLGSNLWDIKRRKSRYLPIEQVWEHIKKSE